ncbi:MAG: cyclase family protein [Bacteroidota bacterium]
MTLPVNFKLAGRSFTADLARPSDISIPMHPDARNVNCYYADEPESETIRSGSFVGSVALGGSVNYKTLKLTPHGNGTHTECCGHISADPQFNLLNCFNRFIFTAELISIAPAELPNGDFCIKISALAAAFQDFEYMPEALIVRTFPNEPAKQTAQYSGTNPPYFEPGCGELLAENGILQFLTDLPSVDREQDEGRLSVHKSFWSYPYSPRSLACITELIYVSSDIPDGRYLVSISPLRLETDASPSRVVLYMLSETEQVS